MKVIILGGGGFVGRNLIRVMLQRGFKEKDIVLVDKHKEGLNYCSRFGAKTVLADISEEGNWQKELNGKDIVINLAAQISSKEYEPFYRNNIQTTKRIVEASKKAKIKKIIHFSSAAVLSVRQDQYATSKKESEEIIKSSGLDYVILRPSLMYGPTDDKNIGWLIEFVKKSPIFPMLGHGKYPRQPIYVDNVCDLVIGLMNNFPKNKIFSINGEKIYFIDMIAAVLKAMKVRRLVLKIPPKLYFLLMRIYQSLPNAKYTTDQVKSLLSADVFPEYPWWKEYNIKLTTFSEGVKNMLDCHSKST